MLMSYVLDAGKNRHNMDTLAEIHLGHKTIQFKDLVGTGKKQINFSEVDVKLAKDYAAEDADITYRLYKNFLKSLKEENLLNIYEIFEKPLVKILAKMEIEGEANNNNDKETAMTKQLCSVSLVFVFGTSFKSQASPVYFSNQWIKKNAIKI